MVSSHSTIINANGTLVESATGQRDSLTTAQVSSRYIRSEYHYPIASNGVPNDSNPTTHNTGSLWGSTRRIPYLRD